MANGKVNRYEFDGFLIDLSKRRLLRDGVVVPLKPKAFDVLAVLVEHNGELLSKADLFRLVWGDHVVEETNLTVHISAIRRALGERARDAKYITNVSGRGYYFNADLRLADGHVTDDPVEPSEVGETPQNSAKAGTEGRADSVPTASVQRKKLFGWIFAVVIVTMLAGAFLLFAGENGVTALGPLSVSKLTTTGRVPTGALSPDGRMFAFNQHAPDGRQSLWVSQVDGGDAIQLRPSSDNPLSVVAFTPDGGKIYYLQFDSNRVSRGTLYRLPTTGGTPEMIREDVSNRPAMSPDGRQFAFFRRESGGSRPLVIGNIDGPADRDIADTSDAGKITGPISWSPDGSRIAAVANSNGVLRPVTISVADGSVEQVPNQEWNSINSIVWTKDSAGLIVAASQTVNDPVNRLWGVAVSSGETKPLLADTNSYVFLGASADNSRILAIQSQSLSNVWVGPANDLAAAKQVTFDMMGKQAGWFGLDWTADGKIIYTARLGKSDSIWQMNADGSGQAALFPENGVNDYPSLPDDNRYVVFASNRTGAAEIWRTNRDGSAPVQLTHGGENRDPHVSPDGKLVVFSAGRNGEERVSTVPIDGGEVERITDQLSDFPRFSPDGTMVACQYGAGTAAQLAVFETKGGPPLKIFAVPTTANMRLGVHWTPDGKAVTYRDWQSGIWRQPLDGGESARLAGLPEEKLFAYGWSRDGSRFAYSRGTTITDVVLLSSLK